MLINKNTICTNPLQEVNYIFWKKIFETQITDTLLASTIKLMANVAPTLRKHGGGVVNV